LPAKFEVVGIEFFLMMRLTKRLLFFSCFSMISGTLLAQEINQSENTTFRTRYGQPDIPGTFVMDFGFTQMMNYPDTLSNKFWASKSVNFYYYYDFKLGTSGITFSPGIGFAFDRYGFQKSITLANPNEDTVQVVGLPIIQPSWDVNKTKLIINYFEIPLELRWHSNPNSFRRSFYVALGGKFGVLIDNSTKIKYEVNDDKFKVKDKRDLSLNKIRYGFLVRMGYKGFSLFYYQNLSTLFEENKGPLLSDPKSFSIGITMRGF
jgi:hypothetical protein